jgi:cytochrome c biogenesis protein CcmG/thiol:disulfide interchange protein DsbE
LKKATSVLALVCLGTVAAWPASAGEGLVHKAAPVFVRHDLHGKRVSLRDERGKVVLLNFWATWCAPCQLELPRFVEWQQRYGPEGLEVIAVSMDDDAGPVRALIEKLKPGFPVVMGDERLGLEYGGILGLPVTYLIGRDGRVAARIAGESDLNDMKSKVVKLLGQRDR